jgi:hypothetical protein
MIVTGFGIVTGNWQNKITKDQYLMLFKNMDSFGHPTGTEAMREFNEKALNDKANNKKDKNNQNKQ